MTTRHVTSATLLDRYEHQLKMITEELDRLKETEFTLRNIAERVEKLDHRINTQINYLRAFVAGVAATGAAIVAVIFWIKSHIPIELLEHLIKP